MVSKYIGAMVTYWTFDDFWSNSTDVNGGWCQTRVFHSILKEEDVHKNIAGMGESGYVPANIEHLYVEEDPALSDEQIQQLHAKRIEAMEKTAKAEYSRKMSVVDDEKAKYLAIDYKES